MEYKGVIEKKILMKVTSRARPEKLINCINEYLRLALNPKDMVWLFTFDSDDNCYNTISFCDSISHIINGDVHFSFGHSHNKIHAINRDVDELHTPHWDILLNISDDQLPVTHGYDMVIRNAMPNDLDASLWFFDSWQMRINTMEILGYNYWLRTKKIYNDSYKSFYCDNEATEVAQILGKLIKSDKCIIKHFHPAATKEVKYDSLYERNQRYWDEDKQTFNTRRAMNYGL